MVSLKLMKPQSVVIVLRVCSSRNPCDVQRLCNNAINPFIHLLIQIVMTEHVILEVSLSFNFTDPCFERLSLCWVFFSCLGIHLKHVVKNYLTIKFLLFLLKTDLLFVATACLAKVLGFVCLCIYVFRILLYLFALWMTYRGSEMSYGLYG